MQFFIINHQQTLPISIINSYNKSIIMMLFHAVIFQTQIKSLYFQLQVKLVKAVKEIVNLRYCVVMENVNAGEVVLLMGNVLFVSVFHLNKNLSSPKVE